MSDKMIIPANFEYTESYIPPRCRKPRFRDIRGECKVAIPCASYDDAPIAMVHEACWFPAVVEYRWYNDQLYKHVPYRDYLSGGEGWWPLTELPKQFINTYFSPYERNENEKECIKARKQQAKRYLILNDDEVWETCGEPRYEIATFGLGHNHASTALMISNHFNPNIPWQRYFTALEREAAVKEAVRVAIARGDTNSVERIRNNWFIEVRIPEAVKCNPKKWGSKGDSFLNTLSAVTETAGSAGEAAVLACALSAIK